MFRQDYILRLIEQLGEALRRMAGLNRKGEHAAALADLDAAWARLDVPRELVEVLRRRCRRVAAQRRAVTPHEAVHPPEVGGIARELKVDAALAERAAWLSKADLLTGMVAEFPELQGVMGRYYALHDGEPPEMERATTGTGGKPPAAPPAAPPASPATPPAEDATTAPPTDISSTPVAATPPRSASLGSGAVVPSAANRSASLPAGPKQLTGSSSSSSQ